ncbi:MAG: tRNA 2-thiouridine(34) synthase MnmA [Candidatus Anammoxibacter sp.]
MNKRVVLAMSGGVDSSVAAYLLKKDGYEVTGLFMRMGDFEEETTAHSNSHGCCSFADSCDARSVAESIGIPFYVLNFEKEFEKVVDYFCAEYTLGRTPNPCIICNQRLKFGKLMDFAKALNADFIATGHYARIENVNGRYSLMKGVDKAKDQSYVLAQLDYEQLSKAIFPLGEINKEKVRSIAADLHLKVKDKAESQEICFVQDDDYKKFIANRIKGEIKPGIIKDVNGNILGEHRGIQFYTIGQRRGLGIALGKPIYVVDIDAENNEITVGSDEDLLSKELFATKLNWISIEPPENPIDVFAKIRYHHRPARSIVYPCKDSVRVEFDEPQPAVTPGQAVVFYDKDKEDVVVGSGWIMKQK